MGGPRNRGVETVNEDWSALADDFRTFLSTGLPDLALVLSPGCLSEPNDLLLGNI